MTSKKLTITPPLNGYFIGREDELATIRQMFVKQNVRVLMLTGEAGIGKTEIAAKYFHNFIDEYTAMAWVENLGGDFQSSMLNEFEFYMQKFGAKNPSDFNELLRMLSNEKGKLLIVLNNFNNPKDLQDHIRNMCSLSNAHILLTTRVSTLNDAHYYHIDGLPYEQALQLFKKHYPKHQAQEDEIFRAIHTAVGQNTLVVELLAKSLQQLNQLKERYTLSNLLQDLQSKGVLGLSQSRQVQTDYTKQGDICFKSETPATIIADMYDITELSEQEMDILSLLPPEALPYEKIEVMLQKNNFTDIDKTLLNLAQKGWLTYNKDEITFKPSPLLHSIFTNAKYSAKSALSLLFLFTLIITITQQTYFNV